MCICVYVCVPVSSAEQSLKQTSEKYAVCRRKEGRKGGREGRDISIGRKEGKKEGEGGRKEGRKEGRNIQYKNIQSVGYPSTHIRSVGEVCRRREREREKRELKVGAPLVPTDRICALGYPTD
jgi:hypothetical protein